jgi:L-aspartate oxidase
LDPLSCDVLIAGSGLSGLTTAYLLAEKGLDIVLITKKTLDESNSYNAQGGVASVVNFTKDSFEKHINDTVEAGVFLNNEDAVRFFVENGPDSIDFLKKIGVEFTEKQNGELDLG